MPVYTRKQVFLYAKEKGVAKSNSLKNGIWQAWRSPASLEISLCQYRRRVDATKLSTSNTY